MHFWNNCKICTFETFQEITKLSFSRILAVKAAIVQFYLTIFYKSTIPFFIIRRIEKKRSLKTTNNNNKKTRYIEQHFCVRGWRKPTNIRKNKTTSNPDSTQTLLKRLPQHEREKLPELLVMHLVKHPTQNLWNA